MSQSTYSITVSCAIASKEEMLALLKKQVEQVVQRDFPQEVAETDSDDSSTTCSSVSTEEYTTQFGKYTICFEDKKYSCTCPHYQYRCADTGKHCKHITEHLNNQ